MSDKHLLALDVGTRKVTGMLLEKKERGFEILSVETREHRTRAMLDGQIHDIPRVAEVVSEVHNLLQQKGQCKISRAAVAAAGRSLYTQRGRAQLPAASSKRITQEDVLRLEYAAIQQAQQQLFSGHLGRANFADKHNCVGYSVVRYELDNSVIRNLVGQRGGSIACEVIATFLPRVVIDSLRGVLELAGLRLQSLTLEPIAALRMVVPEEMRKLNVALVDIGAGTSDIAITRDGTVFAYEMVSVAGDEITEALAEKLLLNFMTAEEIKRKILKTKLLTFKNILDEKVSLSAEKVLKELEGAIDFLTDKIAQAILDKNGVAPQVVFCVGGGSLTPGLTETLAEKLAMDPNRVAIKGKEMLGLLPGKTKKYQGPELVTPLGIAHTAISGDALHFYRVEVNNQFVDVMDLGNARVSDALLAAGISSRELVGLPGKGLSLEINGRITVFPGEIGEMAEIRVNGEIVNLDTAISAGDKIFFTSAKPGAEAKVNVADALSRITPFVLQLNGKEKQLQPPVFRGEEKLTLASELFDRDKLRILKTMPLSCVLTELGLEDELRGGSIIVTVNGSDRQIPFGPRVIRVNGKVSVPGSAVSAGDFLEIADDGSYPTVDCLTEERPQQIELTVNKQIVKVSLKEVDFSLNGKRVPLGTPLTAGDIVEISVINHEVSMADILNIINFKGTPSLGQNKLVLRINEREAQFTTAVKHGDCLEIGWTA
ncbi:MAG: rod shape-determining protein [Clostridium sp.]|nr:rod shape-determining protein [Clostridium sp.]